MHVSASDSSHIPQEYSTRVGKIFRIEGDVMFSCIIWVGGAFGLGGVFFLGGVFLLGGILWVGDFRVTIGVGGNLLENLKYTEKY